jgi:hypothetical protein
MTARRRRTGASERELAAKLRSRRGESEDWGERPVPADIAPHRGVVMSVRLPVSEFVALQRAAKAAGQTVSDYVRSAIATRLQQAVLINAIDIFLTGSSPGSPSNATFLAPALEAGRTRNSSPNRDDMPPRFANLVGER